MTSISKSIPTSPCSDCSLSSSLNRSEWFRQSVLFWSSQSERSDECTMDSNCACHHTHPSDSFASSQMSILSNLSPRSDTIASPKSSSPQHRKLSPIMSRKSDNNEHKIIEFYPSDLLKQVEELEKCFEKTPSEVSLRDDESPTLSGTASPHMTLEFPAGSDIKKNPLYTKDIKEKSNDFIENEIELTATTIAGSHDNTLEELLTDDVQNKSFSETTQGSPIMNDEVEDDDELNDRNIFESIQEVQNTLLEISREIELSSSKEDNTSHNYNNSMDASITEDADKIKQRKEEEEEEIEANRDPNAVMRNWLSNIKPPPPPSSLNNGDNLLQNGHGESHYDVPRLATKPMSTTEDLLQQIDQLMEFEKRKPKTKTTTTTTIPTVTMEKVGSLSTNNPPPVIRERLDSGLQSTSSDSTSPYPSPDVKRALGQNAKLRPERRLSPNSNFHRGSYVIHEVLHEPSDSVFKGDDSDFSDWSPISTLDSTRGSSASMNFRPRSHSIAHPPNLKQPYVNNEFRMSTGNMANNGELKFNMTPQELENIELLHEKHEADAVRKFLALTNKYFDKDGASTLKSTISLDDIALLPTIKDAINEQRKELADQRQKQEEFLHQLGDLLLEIVNLKEEHSVVRSKQTKALNILKKQLDIHKKTQTQAHTDVVNKVNSLDEKINTSISYSAEQLASSPSFITNRSFSFGSPDLPQKSGQRGHIIWKISDVIKKLTRIKSGSMEGTVVSPPFLTSEYGYKMNAWLYVNGRGKMVGKYLSLYICVLVGDYDAILPWPIRPSYTLTLMDQQSDVKKRKDHVKVRRVIDIAGRGANVISQCGGIPRPNDCTKALIVGFDDFISHEELLNRRYLVDDVLFLNVEAEVT